MSLSVEEFIENMKPAPDIIDISNDIPFVSVCEFLEELKNAEDDTAAAILQKKFTNFQKFRKNYQKKFNLSDQPVDGRTSFYCILRCLLATDDKARDPYRVQSPTVIEFYAKVMRLNPFALKDQVLGQMFNGRDAADVLYNYIRSKGLDIKGSGLTLREIHYILDSIADKKIRGEPVLTYMMEHASAFEQKWMIRLMLQKSRANIGRQQIFTCLHHNALDYYNRCLDLKRTCLAIENNDVDLSIIIAPFQPIRPMLCERLNLSTFYDILGTDILYAETKMDGERFQIHMANGTYKYISRNGIDFTKYFGEHENKGNLTPLLRRLLNIKVKSVILDGEMMVWNKLEKIFCRKGENYDVKSLRQNRNVRPCFVVYDLLYLNGDSLLERPFVQRIQILQEILKESPGVLQFVKRMKLCTVSHFTDIFNSALDANEEGIVIKKQKSIYQPNSRKGGWYKVKPDYISDLISDLDLLVMGGFYNSSKTYIKSYVVGVVKKVSEELYEVLSVGRVASGLTRDERTCLNGSTKWKATAKHAIPTYLKFGDNHQPDVWIEPKESTVLEIKASQLNQSSSYATPFALHFPRVEALRPDKVWTECLTLEQYEKFYNRSESRVKKITQRTLNDDDMISGQKIRKSKKQARINAYVSNFKASKIEKTSSVFEGFNFCILSGGILDDKDYSIDDLKELVVKGGGILVENPSPKDPTCICIAGHMTLRAQMLRDTNNFNIISMSWLLEMSEKNRMELKRKHMICMNAEMEKEFRELSDVFGDSFTDLVDEDELKQLITNLENSPFLTDMTELEIIELEKEMLVSSTNFFRGTNGYFTSNSRKSFFAKAIFQFRGGVPVSQHSDKYHFIFVDPDEIITEDLEKMLSTSANEHLIQIVSIVWILDSNREEHRLRIDDYLINV